MSGAGSSGFSVTERQIALLVAQGRTNTEVAEAVGLSPKTVEWHLSNVYRRLQLRSRTELAIRMLEHGLAREDREAPAAAEGARQDGQVSEASPARG